MKIIIKKINAYKTRNCKGVMTGLSLLRKKEETMPEPIIKVERKKCPFYGFHIAGIDYGAMMDSAGNQCALIKSSYSPCGMEKLGKAPNWNICPIMKREQKERLEKHIAEFKVFPNEFHPKNEKSWAGILFKDWIKYVMG